MPFDGPQQQQILDDLTIERFKSWLQHSPFFVGRSKRRDHCPLAYWLEAETGADTSVAIGAVEIGGEKYLPTPWMAAFINYVDLGRRGKITRWRALRALRRLEAHWKSHPPSSHAMKRISPNAL